MTWIILKKVILKPLIHPDLMNNDKINKLKTSVTKPIKFYLSFIRYEDSANILVYEEKR